MPERCGSLHNHTDGEVRGCILDRGHGGLHLSADRVRWQRANFPQVVRLGLGAAFSYSYPYQESTERVPVDGVEVYRLGVPE
jgi:hypothetical protein